MESISKIYFTDNPYPNGHNIEEFSWSGRIDEYGSIYFDFHLKTENYYANDDENEEDEAEGLPDWDSKIVWGNYHACILSSKYWGEQEPSEVTNREKNWILMLLFKIFFLAMTFLPINILMTTTLLSVFISWDTTAVQTIKSVLQNKTIINMILHGPVK